MVIRQSQDVSGGCTGSLFPEIDKFLEDTDHQLALQFVASRKNMDRYHSMVDFLFAEIFIKYRGDCFRFYSGDGPQLRNSKIATKENISMWQSKMIQALKHALEVFQEKRQINWTRFRFEVLSDAA